MKKTAITIIGWVISLALLGSLAARMDLRAMLAGLGEASGPWLAAAATINVAVVTLKALRWKWLMPTERPAAYSGILRATMIGMAGNNVLPARGGDWMKIYLLGKWAGASKAALASVTGLDKLFDGMAILILFGILSLHSTFPDWVRKGTTEVSIAIAVSLAICILLLIHHRRIPEAEVGRLGAVSRLAKRLGGGMGALSRGRLVAATLANSIAIAALQVVTIWCCQMAFGRGLDAWVPALVFVAINLALTVPAAPSGIGPFEAAAVLTYAWLGLPTEAAFNIAIMYHAVQFFPITLAGFILYLKHGTSKEAS